MALIAGTLLPIALLAAVLAFGVAAAPPPLASIADPFKDVDFSDLPVIQKLEVDHGAPVAVRAWGPASAPDVIVAIHGSTATSASLHVFGRSLATRGIAVIAPDVRGHGDTGRRGDIDYAGQLDDDLRVVIALARARHPTARVTLLGFSLGGALVLRNAAGSAGASVDRMILLSPVLAPGAPTMKPSKDDPWARPHIPRLIGLNILNNLGIHVFDGLEAIAYAVPPGAERIQTGRYSWRLLRSFFPRDYAVSLREAKRPVLVLVGEKDELFQVDRFEPTINAAGANIPVKIVPGVDHIGMTLQPHAIAAIANALRDSGK